MSHDTAALMARVIPVFALGLGLELRSPARTALGDAGLAALRRFYIWALSAVLAMMAPLEESTIRIAWTPDDVTARTLVGLGVVATFCAPALSALRVPWFTRRGSARAPLNGVTLAVAFLIAVLATATAIL